MVAVTTAHMAAVRRAWVDGAQGDCREDERTEYRGSKEATLRAINARWGRSRSVISGRRGQAETGLRLERANLLLPAILPRRVRAVEHYSPHLYLSIMHLFQDLLACCLSYYLPLAKA